MFPGYCATRFHPNPKLLKYVPSGAHRGVKWSLGAHRRLEERRCILQHKEQIGDERRALIVNGALWRASSKRGGPTSPPQLEPSTESCREQLRFSMRDPCEPPL